MLNFMRRNANSWVMIFLFGIIVFVFVVNFGPWAGNNMQGIPHAAVVNNVPIPMSDFRTAYASQFARIKQFRPDYDQAAAEKDGLKQLVIDQLINRELLSQAGAKSHLKVGAVTLATELKERVFGDEPFNKEEYARRINAFFQTSIADFEKQVAKEMVAQNMNEILATTVYISDDEVKREFVDQNTKVAVDFVKVDPMAFTASAVSPETIKAFQEKNADKISAYYNENISKFVKEAEIKASHILVKRPANAGEAELKAAKDKAQKILDRLKNNEDFAEVAKAESDDTGSKATGGDLGFFTAGMMVEEFSNAAFALKPGELSGIVESPFGFHIIKQTESRPKTEKKLEDASLEIAENLLKKQEQDQKAKTVANEALAQLKSGAAVANIKASGVTADETEPFSRNANFIGKIGKASGIAEKAFTLSSEKPTSDVIEANGAFFVLRLKSKTDADLAKFEEQKAAIKNSLLYPRKRAFTEQFVSQLKAKAKISYNEALLNAPAIEM